MESRTYNSESPNGVNPYNNGVDNSDEIDLKEIIGKLWRKRKFIIVTTAIFMVVGVVIAFVSPVSYTASCTLVPQSGGSGGGGMSGLASMMGVNMGSASSGETLSPTVYPQIINSVPFGKEIMDTPIVVDKSNGEEITLYDYYTDSRYKSANVIGSIKKYTIGLPGLILSSLKSEEPTLYSDSITGKVMTITKDEKKVIEAIKENIQFTSNDKDGYINVGYSFSEPQATAVIAQNIHTTLEKYVTNYKSQKQQDNLQFVQESYERAREDFMRSQANLAAFQDANRDLVSAMARTTERSLTAEYNVAYTVYNELARQLEQAKIAVNESVPVLTVIDPVVVPHEKSAPRRGIIMFAFTFLGIVAAVGWVFVKPFIDEVRSEVVGEG